MWLCITVFGGLSITLPASHPRFFDIKFDTIPLENNLPPVLEVESLLIHPLPVVDSPSFETLLKPDRTHRSQDGNVSSATRRTSTEKLIEQLNESAELPRLPSAPLAPTAPEALTLQPADPASSETSSPPNVARDDSAATIQIIPGQ
jgi:hypothetical protein